MVDKRAGLQQQVPLTLDLDGSTSIVPYDTDTGVYLSRECN